MNGSSRVSSRESTFISKEINHHTCREHRVFCGRAEIGVESSDHEERCE